MPGDYFDGPRDELGGSSDVLSGASDSFGGLVPLPATNLVMSFAADSGVVTSGATVTQWTDQTANGLHGTEPTTPPTLTTDYAGRPIVQFLSGQQMSFGQAHIFNAEDVSVFLACQHRGGAAWLRNYAGGAGVIRNPGTPDGFYIVGRDTLHKFRFSPSLYGMISRATVEGHTEYESTVGLAALFSDANCDGVLLIDAMDVYAMAVYEGAPPPIADIRAHFASKYGLRATPHAKHMVWIGDSITAGFGLSPHQSFPSQSLRTTTQTWRMTNRGDSGAAVANLTAAAAVTDSLKIASIARNVMTVMIGRNDSVTDTGDVIYNNLKVYVQARVAAGWEVWVATSITTSNPTLYARLQDLNQRIRGTTGPGIIADAGATRVIDFGGLPEFDDLADASTGDFQGDGTHPSVAGSLKLANLMASTLASA